MLIIRSQTIAQKLGVLNLDEKEVQVLNSPCVGRFHIFIWSP